jgi:hypothetical protein
MSKFVSKFAEAILMAGILFCLAIAFANAQTVIISEPESFSWVPVMTDSSGAAVDPGRVGGYDIVCSHSTLPDVSLNTPDGASAGLAVASGTFGLGSWDCLLSAVDLEPLAPPALSATATFVVTQVEFFPLSAPGDFEVTFSTNPQ